MLLLLYCGFVSLVYDVVVVVVVVVSVVVLLYAGRTNWVIKIWWPTKLFMSSSGFVRKNKGYNKLSFNYG